MGDWVKACGRPANGHRAFSAEKDNRHTDICSKHFDGGEGPMVEYPDPIPALSSQVELESFVRKIKRRSRPSQFVVDGHTV